MKAIAIIAVLGATSSAQAAIEQQRTPAPAKAPQQAPAPKLTRAPELLTFVNAPYPPELLAQGMSGEASLLIDIDATGKVERVEVTSATEPAFGEAAMLAATQFVFSPAEVDGKPAAIRIEYHYAFEPVQEEPDAIAGEPSSVAAPLLPINFVGLVREAGNRKPIDGAVVSLGGQPVAETDEHGRFSLAVPPGKIKVSVKSRYHKPYAVEEDIAEGERLEVKYYLERTAHDPYETIVRTKSEQREVAKVELERQELSRVPGTFGDPVRVIENLPGMARTPGGLGGALLVRGASPQDSAVFIDGVEVPLLYHFGGLTSVVNAEFLERIDFYPGGFGARYGRATAGVVDVVSRDLNCEMMRGAGEINVMLSAAYLCSPTGGWATAVAARRSYYDLFLPFIIDQIPREPDEGSITAAPRFWDYQAKTHGRIGRNTFDVFAFGANDRLRIIQSGSTEDLNVNAGLHIAFHRLVLRHRFDFSDKLKLTSSLAPGYELRSFETTFADLGTSSGGDIGVLSLAWREDLSYKLNDAISLSGGIDHNLGRGSIDVTGPAGPNTFLREFPTPTFDFTETQNYHRIAKGFDQAYWLEALLRPHKTVKIIQGFRFQHYDLLKTQGYTLQPRLAVRWEFLPGSTAKGAYGVYEKLPDPQYLLDSIGNPKLLPERSEQFILGFEQTFTDLINLDVQAYYNHRTHLRSPSNTITYKDGKAIPEIWNNDGRGRAFGLEILLRHLARADSSFYGWIAYTLSRAERQDRRLDTTLAVQQANGQTIEVTNSRRAQTYLVPWDQTHILTVVGQWILPWWGLEAGFRFRLVSGNPYTPLQKGQVYYDADSDTYRVDLSDVPRNSGRLPFFDQLDVRVDKNFIFNTWKLTAYLELLNAYNASNAESYQYDYRYRQQVPVSFLPIVPVLGVKGEF